MAPITRFNWALSVRLLVIAWTWPCIVLGEVKDLKLADQLGKDILSNQANISNQEIVLKLTQIKTGMRRLLMQDVPWKVAKGLDRPIILNTFALLRLTDVSSERCYQPDLCARQENVHKHNYIELADVCRQFYSSSNMQAFIDDYANAQFKICQNALGFHAARTWQKVEDVQPYANKFKKLLLKNFKQNKPVAELTSDERIFGLMNFMKQFHDVNTEAESELAIVKAYNELFREACNTYVLHPFYTIMMTYEKTGRNARFLERHHGDLIKLFDLCSNLPNYITQISVIGSFRPVPKEIIKPAASAGEFRRDMDKDKILEEKRRLRDRMRLYRKEREKKMAILDSNRNDVELQDPIIPTSVTNSANYSNVFDSSWFFLSGTQSNRPINNDPSAVNDSVDDAMSPSDHNDD